MLTLLYDVNTKVKHLHGELGNLTQIFATLFIEKIVRSTRSIRVAQPMVPLEHNFEFPYQIYHRFLEKLKIQ